MQREATYSSPSGVYAVEGRRSHRHLELQGTEMGEVSATPLPPGSHTVLVPIDGSASSKAAFDLALQVTTPADHVLVFHDQRLSYHPTMYPGEVEGSVSTYEERASEDLRDFASIKCTDAHRDCEWILHNVVGGSTAVAKDIATVTTERGVDQVVMGSRGWSSALGVSVALGSVSTRVLEMVKCPVTLVRDQTPPPPEDNIISPSLVLTTP